eukprot:INCI16886.1.p2 GENE.INCI16886.1~~INCI16886.1.p2  ORF type:complete len:313 (+),score=81.33 INCI16886.1:192-1130(+)
MMASEQTPFAIRVVLLAPGHTEELDILSKPEATVAELETQVRGKVLRLLKVRQDARAISQAKLKLFFRGNCINDCETNTLSAWEVGAGALVTALPCKSTEPDTVDLSRDGSGDTIDLSQEIEFTDESDDNAQGGNVGGVHSKFQGFGNEEPPRVDNNPLNILQHHPGFQQLNTAIHCSDLRAVENILNTANTPISFGEADDEDDLRHTIAQQPNYFCDVVTHTPALPADVGSDASDGERIDIAQLFRDNDGNQGNSTEQDSGDDGASQCFEVSAEAIEQLCSLGFTTDTAIEALKATGGDAAAAANHLLDLT